MPYAAVLSRDPNPELAASEIVRQAKAVLNQPEWSKHPSNHPTEGGPPDLALVFFTPHYVSSTEGAMVLSNILNQELAPRCLLGCVAEGVLSNDQEVEAEPGVSLWLARWNHPIQLTPFHLVLERTADGPGLFGWPDALTPGELELPRRDDPVGLRRPKNAVLLLGDPYTFPVDLFLRRVNEDAPGLPVLGGMASGVRGPGSCHLLHGNTIQRQGAVGVLLQGELGLRWIVSQGCRPIGRPLIVTRSQENVIHELSGRPPWEQLQELWPTLTPEEQHLFQQGLHIGRVINEYQGEFQRGDFLVRNVLGLERSTGALIITDHVRVGTTVQFHVRDAQSADEDLHALLQMDLNAHVRKPASALVFSCNGRGTRMFPEPHHDVQAVRSETGTVPVAGFFAQGELGPVGGQNFIHGFTASVALFEETGE